MGVQTPSFQGSLLFNMRQSNKINPKQSNKTNPKQSNKTNPWQEKIFFYIKMAKTLIPYFFQATNMETN
jgi:hypothetical protein